MKIRFILFALTGLLAVAACNTTPKKDTKATEYYIRQTRHLQQMRHGSGRAGYDKEMMSESEFSGF